MKKDEKKKTQLLSTDYINGELLEMHLDEKMHRNTNPRRCAFQINWPDAIIPVHSRCMFYGAQKSRPVKLLIFFWWAFSWHRKDLKFEKKNQPTTDSKTRIESLFVLFVPIDWDNNKLRQPQKNSNK